MNLQIANLQNLLNARFTGNWNPVAERRLLQAISTGDDRFLTRMLRSHRMGSVSDPEEIEFRAAIDGFLSFCGVLEIAAMSGFIELPTSNLVWKPHFGAALENEHLRRYYEDIYPTPLPQLLRLRLEGTNAIVRNAPSNVVLAFLQLNDQFLERLEGCVLLRMLDSFTIKGKRFGDVVDLVEDPRAFVNAMLAAPTERDVTGRALHDFSALMQFCFDLHATLLQRIEDELLRSAVWYQYGYWFRILGAEFRANLGKAVSKFRNWDIEALGGDHDARATVRQYVQDAIGLLDNLTSPDFADPIDSLLQELKAGPHLGMSP